MKKMKRFLGSLALTGMLLSLALPGQKVEAKDYTGGAYQIRVFAGKQGTFKGGSSMKEYKPGETFDLDSITVTPETAEDNGVKYEYEKYYVKGIKPSGADLELSNPAFTDVTKDMDYVVVYGIANDEMVDYTVEYIDNATGKPFPNVPSKHYKGKVGDKPIVPYLYIEGYVPQAYNLTMTLRGEKDKPEGNVMRFYYTRVTAGGGGGGGGDTTVYDEETVTTTNTTPVIVPGEGGNAAGAAGGGVTVVPGDGAAANAGAGAGDGGEAAAPAEPEELVDLDDEEVPLANIPGSNGGSGIGSEPGSFFVNMPPAVIVGIVSMAVLVVAAAWYLIFMRKKKGTGEDGQE